jgi:cytochrome c
MAIITPVWSIADSFANTKGLDAMSGAAGTFNTISMSVLLVAAGTLGVNILSGELFKAEKPEKPGFAVAVAEAPAAAGAAKEVKKTVAEVMASASAEKGASVFKQCATCHTIDKGGANKVGPNLYGVVTRAVASHEGFNYSAGIKAKASEKWTFEALNEFIINPKGYVSGTAMSFAGLKKDSDRGDLLAYLREQSDNKAELPK